MNDELQLEDIDPVRGLILDIPLREDESVNSRLSDMARFQERFNVWEKMSPENRKNRDVIAAKLKCGSFHEGIPGPCVIPITSKDGSCLCYKLANIGIN